MELTINNLIKMILGLLVIVAVVAGVAFFALNISDFFGNLGGNVENFFLALI